MIATDVIAWVLLSAALVVFVACAIGTFRMHTAYELLSIVTLAATVRLACVILSAVFFQPSPANIVKGLLAVALQLVTTSVGSSVAGRALHLRNTPVRAPSELPQDGAGPGPETGAGSGTGAGPAGAGTDPAGDR